MKRILMNVGYMVVGAIWGFAAIGTTIIMTLGLLDMFGVG